MARVAARDGNDHVAVIGGVAMMVYGSYRVTADLDVVSINHLSLTPKKHLSFGGFTTSTSEGCPVDVVV